MLMTSRKKMNLTNLSIRKKSSVDFLKVMEIDAVGSRNEEGCLRFDVLCDQSK